MYVSIIIGAFQQTIVLPLPLPPSLHTHLTYLVLRFLDLLDLCDYTTVFSKQHNKTVCLQSFTLSSGK